MKTLFLLTILLLSLISTSCWGVDWDDLVEREGLYYKKFTETPFTGEVTGRENGTIKNGKHEGEWVTYHPNGQLSGRGSWKNGEREGLFVGYHSNGRYAGKANFKNGKWEGEWVSYYDDGKLKKKGNYNNDKKEGEWVYYLSNGKVYSPETGTFKNGKKVSD
jgi:hypothetical protein